MVKVNSVAAGLLHADFRDAAVKEGKQAEFLMFDVFPWTLVEKTASEVVTKIHAWNKRKQMFESRHIHLAWERLREFG